MGIVDFRWSIVSEDREDASVALGVASREYDFLHWLKFKSGGLGFRFWV